MEELSEKEIMAARAANLERGKEMLEDPNRLAKVTAVYLRDQLKNFQGEHLSDEQMAVLVPLIRNAVFTYLKDYGEDYSGLACEESLADAVGYVSRGISPILRIQGLSSELIAEFMDIVDEFIYVPFKDFEMGSYLMAAYEVNVPVDWEDCVYNSFIRG